VTAKILHGLDELTERPDGCVVTIGNFDGVHRGHQSILATARGLAEKAATRVVAISFQPPPVQVLAPDRPFEALMQLSQRCDALLLGGADTVLLLHTTEQLLSMTPVQFVRDVLVERLAASHVVEGPSFFFGHNRAGNVETLAELGGGYGFDVHVVERVTVNLADGSDVTVSSSLIRDLIRDGRVADAAVCLGRPYTMLGAVVCGRGLGRQLDYHTANLDCGEQLLPGDGVYSGFAVVGEHTWPAAISVGTRPTFGDLERALEAHVLGDPGELYGREMALRFSAFVRPQQAFETPDQLRWQINKDIQRVREQLD